MPNVEAPTVGMIAREIVAREGGYVNDPDDPGGATKYGVTIGTMRALGMDLDGNGRVDRADVKALTREQAEHVFVEHYFHRPRLAELPETVQASVFDMYVNSGANAVKILQRLVTRMGCPANPDGVIGPLTVSAAHAAADAAPEHLADAYGIARRNYYYALADRRSASRKYARTRKGGKGGWITRAESFISPRYHLSETEHRRRIAQWG
ncbi:holin-associated N-acetylmuramidase [Paracoccus onubensis]|uniref:holin-associated N-acetylmuramidase n=1 Tax=Paracoccus onubensis TaxID=1675788 RepID=UPI0027313E11|nr:holin-associated N-acetylmuramidase [Paracoccus onubensis]MDP0925824.1 holin-associated N-acetylmuramidase [Paracoccus onubensis]